jgi:2,4-dienoyl-CoA reductase-like NADH-dependent reductase (Old Yellow Enzyme family)
MKGMIKMAEIFKELKTKNFTFKNRVILAPVATKSADDNGYVTDKILDYYDKRSKGGYLSLIITEHVYVTENGKGTPHQISIADDDKIEGLKKLTDTIHKNGVKVFAQLNHVGAKRDSETNDAPSAFNIENIWKSNREITKEEILEIEDNFVKAAVRAKLAGYDGIELHSCHGFLLNEFYSPVTNRRTDEYGGNIHNRIRIHLEIIKKIRKAVGENYPIFLRLGAVDFREGGNMLSDSKKAAEYFANGSTLQDAIIAAKAFEKAGIEVLDISGGLNGYTVNGKKEAGYYSELTQAIRKEVSIPVILTGGITKLSQAEKLLEDEKSDIIGVGRAILTDENWVEREFSNFNKEL